jgi:hypothetical protein
MRSRQILRSNIQNVLKPLRYSKLLMVLYGDENICVPWLIAGQVRLMKPQQSIHFEIKKPFLPILKVGF